MHHAKLVEGLRPALDHLIHIRDDRADAVRFAADKLRQVHVRRRHRPSTLAPIVGPPHRVMKIADYHIARISDEERHSLTLDLGQGKIQLKVRRGLEVMPEAYGWHGERIGVLELGDERRMIERTINMCSGCELAVDKLVGPVTHDAIARVMGVEIRQPRATGFWK